MILRYIFTWVLLCVAAMTGRATRPDEQSLYTVLEQRAVQSANSSWERAACRLLAPAGLRMVDVKVNDCGVCSVAAVTTGNRRFCLVGILGRWYRIR